MAEGSDAQKAQLAHAQRNLPPRTIADMRPVVSTEGLGKSKRVLITTGITTSSSQVPPTLSQAPMSVLSSKMHHQHIMNRGAGQGELGRERVGGRVGGARLGGTKPPAVFVQKHSDN